MECQHWGLPGSCHVSHCYTSVWSNNSPETKEHNRLINTASPPINTNTSIKRKEERQKQYFISEVIEDLAITLWLYRIFAWVPAPGQVLYLPNQSCVNGVDIIWPCQENTNLSYHSRKINTAKQNERNIDGLVQNGGNSIANQLGAVSILRCHLRDPHVKDKTVSRPSYL